MTSIIANKIWYWKHFNHNCNGNDCWAPFTTP